MSDGTLRKRTSEASAEGGDAHLPLSGYSDDCESQLRFESLLTDISARLTNVDNDHLDEEIVDAQRRVCEMLSLDISALWQWAAEAPENFILTHLYRAVDGPPVPERMDAKEYQPWSFEQALAGRLVVLNSMNDAPPEAVRDRETWNNFGIRTTVTVPLRAGNETPFGAVSFNDIGTERQWSDRLVSRLQLIAQVFGNAILRKRSEQALRQSEARLSLAAESAGAGLWSLNLGNRCFWITDRARQLFAFGEDENVNFDRFLELVHPKDQDMMRQTLEKVLSDKQDLAVEYRVVDPDGNVRWMASQGHYQEQVWGETEALVMGVTVDVTTRKQEEQRLHLALKELEDLREKLRRENEYLRVQVKTVGGPGTIIGASESIKSMLDEAARVAPTDSAVLTTGETGTGKELLAQAIHDLSSRKRRTLVKVNCAALPAALIESELFGREKGAYTGAMTRQVGRFEVADKSTILLDEIGDLPLDLQAKLLRVLEDGTFERLGSTRTTRVDVRVIAATNRDLGAMVAKGSFREDLYHRLNVFPIVVPPLRDRVVDIPLLVWAFVEEFNTKMGRSIESVPKSTIRQLESYSWPGNVRELRNVIERAMIVSQGKSLRVELPATKANRNAQPCTLEDLERRHICEVLDRVHWRISGKGGAAEILGLVPTTLHSRMKKLGISRAENRR